MNKLISFLKLKGEGVLREKFRYVLKKSEFMGQSLKKDTIVSNGYNLFFCRKNSIDLHIISMSYEFEVVKLFEKLIKESKLIVDVGANIGKYSILSGKFNPDAKVIAIEPETNNYWNIHKNIELNNLWDNTRVFKLALGSHKDKLKLYVDGKNNGGHSLNYDLVSKSPEGRYSSSEEVKVDTLDSLFHGEEIDLLKIDTEGTELEVLKGSKELLLKGKIKNIIIEVNDLPKIKSFLKKYNYGLEKIQYSNYLATLKKTHLNNN